MTYEMEENKGSQMIERLRRTKRYCTIISFVVALLLLVVATTSSRATSAIAAFCLIAVVVVSSVIENHLTGRIKRLLEEENRSKPIICTPATVISSRMCRKLWTYGGHRAPIRATSYWYVTFRTLKHGDVELYVPHDIYLAAQKGKQGNLCYQGWKFISFR